jgi:coenzyme PQQ precursor peptide PqqA
MGPAWGARLPFVAIATTMEGLIPHCFDWRHPHNSVNCLCGAASLMQHTTSKKLVANPSIRITVSGRAKSRPSRKRSAEMAWKAPKIVEVSVGMEINMYMCATRK